MIVIVLKYRPQAENIWQWQTVQLIHVPVSIMFNIKCPSDVAVDDGVVEADGFHEEELEALLDDDGVVKRPPPFLRRVGGVENSHLAVLVLQVLLQLML